MEQAGANLDRVLVLEMVRVTEAAAIAASRLIGRGDEKAADAAAVEARRLTFEEVARSQERWSRRPGRRRPSEPPPSGRRSPGRCC